jgi:hypothetical protein
MIHGRRALDRAGIAEYTGAAEATVEKWHLDRDNNTGFPRVCHTGEDGRHWYWQTDVTAFWKRHQAAKQAALTPVNRSGDPDEYVTAPEAAKILGYKSHRNLPPALVDNPDDTEALPSGRQRRRWRRSTIWAYADSRTADKGGGRPAGSGTHPHKGRNYGNDPRLDTAVQLVKRATASGHSTRGLGTELAAKLGVDERTARRLIAAAKDLAAS